MYHFFGTILAQISILLIQQVPLIHYAPATSLSQFLFTSKSPANTSIPHRQVFSGDLSAVNMSSCYKGFGATRNNLRFCVNGSELFTQTFQNLRYRLFRPIQTRLKFLTGYQFLIGNTTRKVCA
jgi:hypothetical protein